MSTRFKTNMNKIRGDASAFDSGGGGAGFMKLADGKNTIRVLPPWKEDEAFYQKVGFHRPPGRDDPGKKVICPDYTHGEKGSCPICKAFVRIAKSKGKDAAKDFKVQKRAYLNVLDMKKADGQVYILEAPATVMNPILNFMAEEESDDLVDPKIGFNILITRSKKNNFTNYDTMIKPGTFDLAAKGYDVDEILDGLNDLDNLVKLKDDHDDVMEEILQALNESVFDEDDNNNADDDDDTPPPKKKNKVQADDDDDDTPPPKSNKKRAAADDDDDDAPAPAKSSKKQPAPADDDDDQGEDEDDVPPPPKKKSAKVVEPEPEEEEEEEPAPKKTLKKKHHTPPEGDDEDDEEPAPRKKSAKSKPIPEDDDEDGGDFNFSDFGPEPSFDSDEDIPF